MGSPQNQFDLLVDIIDEQAKGLSSLYEIEEVLHNPNIETLDALEEIAMLIEDSFKIYGKCSTTLRYREHIFQYGDKNQFPHKISSDIIVRNRKLGSIKVTFKKKRPKKFESEKQFLQSVAYRIADFLLYRRLKTIFYDWKTTKQEFTDKKSGEWQVILELLRRTDPELYFRISRKMLNYLIWQGYK